MLPTLLNRTTLLSLLLVLGCATSSRAEQFVLFDVTFPYTKSDADNAKPSPSHYYVKSDRLNAERPKDWTAPVDYRNGTVHVRLEVIEKPAGSEPTTWSVCYIPNKGQNHDYGCIGTNAYFAAFTLMLRQQRDAFAFTTRTRRPPRDRINCLLSFLYALLRNDCVAALTAAGLDPFVGFLHADRPARPSLALDLMEEFRPWLADRVALTLINRQQIAPGDFREREGGAVELTDAGRRLVVKAWQERKQEELQHPLLEQTWPVGRLPFVQARVLARALRGDLPAYIPFVVK